MWTKLSNFTGGVINPASTESGSQLVGNLAANSATSKYFLLTASAITTTAQTHTITLYTGDPSAGGTALCNRTFTYTSVIDTIKASANKLTGSSLSSATAVIGQTVNLSIIGQTGTLGAGPSYDPGVMSFAPNVYTTFPANVWRLVNVSVTVSPDGVAAPVTYSNVLKLTNASGPDRQHTAVYSFQAIAPKNTTTAVAPIQYIASGTQIKHTDISSPRCCPPSRRA